MTSPFGTGPFGSATPSGSSPFGSPSSAASAGPFAASPQSGPFAGPPQSGPFASAPESGPFAGPDPHATIQAGPFGGSSYAASPFGQVAGMGGFETMAPGGVVVHKPPVLILAGSALLMLAAAVGASVSGLVVVAFICWFLAGPVGTGLLALFQNRDSVARSKGVYSREGWVTPAFYASVVLCLAAVTICALRIAMWAGRQ